MTGYYQLVKHFLYQRYNRPLLSGATHRAGHQPAIGAYVITSSDTPQVSLPCALSRRRW